MDELMRADAAREAGLTELQRYLDAEGGIAAAKHAGDALSDIITHARQHTTHQDKVCRYCANNRAVASQVLDQGGRPVPLRVLPGLAMPQRGGSRSRSSRVGLFQ